MTVRNRTSRRLILFLIIITSFINPFLGAAINIALPAISGEFSLGAVGMSWVAMAFLLSSAVFLVPLGKLADIKGRKRIFFIGNIIIVVTSILCALSQSGGMIISLRAIQGIGSAMVFGTGIAIITSVYPPKERGKAIGITVTSVYIGLSLAPFLGGMLTQYLGWRSIFYATVPFELVVIWITWRTIKEEWADAKGEKFDLTGSIIYLLSMSAFMFGFSRLPEISAIILAAAGLLGLVGFSILEMKLKFPIFNIQLFTSNRLFAFSNLAALINYATTFAITFLLSLYLQYIMGLSPRDAGMILITQPVMMAIVASISGRLSDRYDPRILGSVDKKYLGVASATVGTMRLTGQMMSIGIATLILQLFLGNRPISTQYSAEFITSMRTTFIVFVILCVVGIFSSLARGRSFRDHI